MADSKQHNFIIFNPDEWRADYAGCYGHPIIQTPNLDRLAAEGTRFEQAHVQSTLCSPSRCSFMTGWYPHTSGHRDLKHLLQPHEPNLLKYLKQAGYDVAWFGKNDLLAPDSFRDSVSYFDCYHPVWPLHRKPAFEQGETGYYSFLYEQMDGTLDDFPDAACVEAGLQFLRRRHTQPFCLFLPLILPHCPYFMMDPYHHMYDPDEMPLRSRDKMENKPTFYQRIHETRGLHETPESVLRKVNAVYGGMITAVDDLLGRILTLLDETGLAENTTVLVFSDHGDWAGDYGIVEKWTGCLDDCLTRVPFVIRTPEGAKGHVVQEPTEVFDIVPTIMELAGLELGHTQFGRSLVPQLQGQPGDPDRAAFADGGYELFEPQCFEVPLKDKNWVRKTHQVYYPKHALQYDEPEQICRCTMIRTSTHKLVYRPTSGEHELYDLQADPEEYDNLYGKDQYDAVQRDLEHRLLTHMIHTSDVTPMNPGPRGMPNYSVYWPKLLDQEKLAVEGPYQEDWWD